MKKYRLYEFLRIIAMPLMKIIFFISFKNENKLPKDKPFVICSNHRSYLDPVFIALGQKRHISFMAKEELFKVPFLGKFIKALGAFSVKRGKGDKTAINHSYELLEQNEVIGIFPEGTRSRTGKLLNPKAGAALFAIKANVPILPAAVCTKGHVGLFKKVTVKYGEFIMPEDFGVVEESSSQIREASKYIMRKIGQLLEE